MSVNLFTRYLAQSTQSREASVNGWRRDLVVALPALTIFGVGTSGCTIGSGPDHNGPDAPTTSDLRTTTTKEEPFTLVLSSGGPRGFVHVGVIQALDELDVRPQFVVGASVGALVAALYCAGKTGNEMRKIALDLGPTQLVRIAIGASERLSGAPLATRVNKALDGRQLQDLQIACAIVAVEKATRQPIVFTHGNPGIAVQASAAIENRFVPVSINGKQYHDADLIVPMPVRQAKALGAGKVLSVDASAHENRAPQSAARYRAGDLRKRRLTQPDAALSDLNLHPDFGYYVSLSTEFRERAMRAGYEETMRFAKEIRKLAAN